ncbi:MAG: iron complex outerrane recepter protein [Betaproteobacteria bacterium]|nr:iron complex outerrane recepter protein [Betaproteobacteria bacterium]
MKPLSLNATALAVACAYPLITLADEATLEPVVVTAPAMKAPLEVSFDPRAPQQPLPATDGASLLKAIPGMSVIRKGGTDGDPLFRGMAASRLNILLDGEQILGGCGMRMDPPTAYVFPDSYNQVTLLKGPQSVVHGPGASAGTVLFERKAPSFDKPGYQVDGALTVGSFGRHDELIDVKAGNPTAYVQGILTHAESDNYQDGDGTEVHSRYRRSSATAIVGWTPDRNTRLEFSSIHSVGEAAYADRGMDGVKFDRSNYGLKFEKKHLGGLIDAVDAQVYYNYVDHVMGNYSLRRFMPTAMMANPSVSNPDRKKTGGRVALTLVPGERTQVIAGLDQQSNTHTVRSSMNAVAMPYEAKPRTDDAAFRNLGLFAEATHELSDSRRLVMGLRADRWKAEDRRQTLAVGMMSMPNPTRGQTREETLPSGFARYEWDHAGGGTAYVGVGHARRAPDYWELIAKESTGSLSSFDTLKPEKTTQLDVGSTWKQGAWEASVSGFVSRVDDYVLIQTAYAKPAMGGMTRTTTVARNIKATTYGGEAGVNHAFNASWKGLASLAWVRGQNDTDDRPLGQMPPLEARFGLDWTQGRWTAGSLLRVVAAQNRYAIGQGNIVGQDLGPTSGYSVFSINGSYRWNDSARVTFGIDNLFDRTYAEAVSRGGAMVAGYDRILRVNEPGRTVWVKAQFTLK